MLILLLIISISLGIFFHKKDKEQKDGYWMLVVISVIIDLTLIIGIIMTTSDIADSMVIDKKIVMYQEENTKIEKDISTMVTDYKQHELEVFDKSGIKSPVVLVQLYPELKSDALVQQQMTLYTNNNAKIKQLKNKQIDYEVSKWWLYFNL